MRTLDPVKDARLIEAVNIISGHLTKTFCEVNGEAEPIGGDRLPRIAFAAPGTYVTFGQLEGGDYFPVPAPLFGTYFAERRPFDIPFQYLRRDNPGSPAYVDTHIIFVFMDVYMDEGEVYFFEGGTAYGLPYVTL